jgi:diguanylate cyclase (GGDEF)-like protein/PAS domain S-box-containing protein
MDEASTAKLHLRRLRAALEAAGDAVLITDPDGIVVEANVAVLRVGAKRREDVIGHSILELSSEAGGDEAELEGIRRALSGEPVTYKARRTRRTVSVTATPLPGGGATFISQGVAAYRQEDVRTARARLLASAAQTLRGPESLEDILAALADMLVPTWGDACLCLLIGPEDKLRLIALRPSDPALRDAVLEMLPTKPSEVLAGGVLARVVAERAPVLVEDPALLHPDVGQRIAELGFGTMVLVPLLADDELIGVITLAARSDSHSPLRADDLDLLATLADRAGQGIHALRLRDAMRAAEGRFRAAFEHAPIGIALSRPGPDGVARFVEVNPAFCQIAGYPRDDLLEQPAREFTHPDDRAGEERRLSWLLERRTEEVSAEKRMVRADGEVRWVLARSASLEDGSYVTQIQDVTEHRRFQTELEHLASHDALTGLLNRRRIEESVELALAAVRRHGDSAAVLTLDIDNFKNVNDTYGHATGDAVLRAVANALLTRVRATDQVGRLGGDEFGIVLTRTDADAAQLVADELLAAVREIRVAVGNRDVRVTASLGLRALQTAETQDAGELLSEADMAMYDAKERGRDRLSVIGPGDLQPARVRERMRWSERIRDALETGDGFVLYEQPILRLADDTVDRSELLLRMTDDDGAIVAPAHFLPVAERYGQIQALDRWVVRSAIALLAERVRAGRRHPLEVNLSGDSISDTSVVDFIVAEIERAAIDPSLLIFEVTETSAISNLERARALASRLTTLGCGFALDDFGAGFGSFAYLKHLPLDIIKIDGQFIRGLCESEADQVTVRAMVDIARGLHKETVAEFAESAAIIDKLRELGVDRAQGYHVGRPAPATVIPAFA